MDAGVHLPLIDFGGEGFSQRRLAETVDAARECGFAAVSANDHLLFPAPWLDGPTALAAVAERSGEMRLVTTLALATLRGPVPLAKALSALDILSDGRLIAGLGPGSSKADYAAAGVPFEDRWQRFDEAVRLLKTLLQPGAAAEDGAYYSAPAAALSPSPRQRRGIPLWLGSWGTPAGLRRVARLGDGWLASAYNTTPEDFAASMRLLGGELERRKRPPGDFPHALVTMWTWITAKRADAERILSGVVGPLVNRDPAQLRRQICVGSAQECAELLSCYARAGCQRVHFWPVGDERRQIELIAGEVMPRVRSLAHWSLTATSFRRVHRRGQGAGASISAAGAVAGRRGRCCVPDRRGLGLPPCGMMKTRMRCSEQRGRMRCDKRRGRGRAANRREGAWLRR